MHVSAGDIAPGVSGPEPAAGRSLLRRARAGIRARAVHNARLRLSLSVAPDVLALQVALCRLLQRLTGLRARGPHCADAASVVHADPPGSARAAIDSISTPVCHWSALRCVAVRGGHAFALVRLTPSTTRLAFGARSTRQDLRATIKTVPQSNPAEAHVIGVHGVLPQRFGPSARGAADGPQRDQDRAPSRHH